jgi:hypothetical protein
MLFYPAKHVGVTKKQKTKEINEAIFSIKN